MIHCWYDSQRETEILFWIQRKTDESKKNWEIFQGNANVLDKEFFCAVASSTMFFFLPLSKFNEWKMWIFKRFEFSVWSITANLEDNYHEIKSNKKENRICFKIDSIPEKKWSGTNASIKDEILNGWRIRLHRGAQ